MIIDFNKMEPRIIPHFNGGEKETEAAMFHDEQNRILYGKLIPGASIGMHCHETSSEIVYILSGTGTVLIEGETETLQPGMCHYCRKGESHSLMNTGSEDLIFFAVVPQQ